MSNASATTLLVVLVFVAGAAPASAAELGLSAEVGFDGFYRAGHLTPVFATITNDTGGPFSGSLEIIQSDDDGDQIRWQASLAVDAGRQERRMVLFCPQPGAIEEGGVRLVVSDAKGGIVASLDLRKAEPYPRPIEPGARVLGIIGRGFGPMGELGANRVNMSERVLVVSIPHQSLPVSWQGLDMIDVLVWDDPDLRDEQLTDERLSALVQWVRRGGQLTVTLGENADVLAGPSSPLASLLPVEQPRSAVQLPTLIPFGRELANITFGELAGATVVVPTNLKGGAVEIVRSPELGCPLLSRWSVDAGSVTVLATRLQSRDIGAGRVWPAVVLAGIVGMPTTTQAPGYSAESLTTRLGSHLDSAGVGGVLVGLVVLMSLGYALLAGPGTWLYLKYRKKAHLSWWVFGLIVLVATVASVLLSLFRIRDASVSRAMVMDLTADSRACVVRGYFGLYEPAHRTVKLELLDDPNAQLVPMIDAEMRPSAGYPDVLSYTIASQQLTELDVPIRRTIKRFAVNWRGDAGGRISGELTVLANPANRATFGHVEGWIRNDLPVSLSDAVLVYAGPGAGADRYRAYRIGLLPAGRVVSLDSASAPSSQVLALQEFQRRIVRDELNLRGQMFGDPSGKLPFAPVMTMLSTLQLYSPPAQDYDEPPQLMRDCLGRLDRGNMVLPGRAFAAPVAALPATADRAARATMPGDPGTPGMALLIATAEDFMPPRIRYDGGPIGSAGPMVVRCVMNTRFENRPSSP